MSPERKLKLALPKGSLWNTTHKLFTEAGYTIQSSDRGYRLNVNDDELEIKLLRPQEIPNYLTNEGGFDLGISGLDWVKETRVDLETILDLEVGGVNIVFCVPTFWSDITSLDDFIMTFHEEGKVLRISTEYLNISIDNIVNSPSYKKIYGDEEPMVTTPWKSWGSNKKVKLFLSFGATEAKPPEEVDAIIDNTETGSTIKANNLKIVEVLDRSTALLIANKSSLEDNWKKEKIKDIKILLTGVLKARKKLHIFMNVKEANLEELLKQLPSLKNPTISKLAGPEGWLAVNTIINRDEFIGLIPSLRNLAQGIVVSEPRQVLPMELSNL
jgi:ATP phosphoribosyltransferase